MEKALAIVGVLEPGLVFEHDWVVRFPSEVQSRLNEGSHRSFCGVFYLPLGRSRLSPHLFSRGRPRDSVDSLRGVVIAGDGKEAIKLMHAHLGIKKLPANPAPITASAGVPLESGRMTGRGAQCHEMDTSSRRPCRITVCYFKPDIDRLISNTTITEAFLAMLAAHANVVTIAAPRDASKIDFGALKTLNADYLLVDILNFSTTQFVLRERHGLDVRFIIILHTVYHWFVPLVHVIPLIRKDDIAIAPSRYAKESFLKITDRIKVNVVPYSLDVVGIRRTIVRHQGRSAKRICFLGRLVESKGIESLIDCMPEIIGRAGNVQLNVIGPLSGDFKANRPKSPFVEKLLLKVKRLGLTKNVTFSGAKLGSSKYRILSKSNVYIFPTTYRGEVFGVSLLEALACGLAIVATRWAANADLIEDGCTGYLVDVDVAKNGKVSINREQLVSSIVKVLGDKRRLALMQATSARLAGKYDFRTIGPQLMRLLTKERRRSVPTNKWESLRTKTVMDYRSHYKKEILPFIHYFCAYDKTYLDVCNAPPEEASMILCNRRNFDGREKTNRLTEKNAHKLFWHLHPQKSGRVTGKSGNRANPRLLGASLADESVNR